MAEREREKRERLYGVRMPILLERSGCGSARATHQRQNVRITEYVPNAEYRDTEQWDYIYIEVYV